MKISEKISTGQGVDYATDCLLKDLLKAFFW